MELPATFLVGGREHGLTDDPIYAAADHLARTEATKADVGAIGRVAATGLRPGVEAPDCSRHD